MPRYDYICLDCQKEETVSLTLKEHETGSIISVLLAAASEWSS
jgi:hypothetical protein